MPTSKRMHRPEVSASVDAFLNDHRYVAALTTVRPDGSLHTAPVRFTWDAESGLARVMTVVSSRKARNLLAAPGGRVALCQVQGFTWVTLEGTGTVVTEPARVAEGARRYAERYWSGPPNPPGRVVIEIEVDRVLSLNA
ncbi:pyridoxamine 5'-phosphate oxidase family protein [Streptomyces sp. OfavH-34-F]|uniref:pyridoxamine 5'-phosphate oxidase family protein n=1 Tax=unclassified Streptomyces TaxID=2593676 RepID=UPI001EF23C50|nr:pyridoxamine 5'-phosphate oxidase family protein [Streptomyces sp. OfavH-34-F]MCG7525119.1 pyridoxamine 5'-phosphate oxidase family protein [Streptomyces sp. OfavH-34-F]